MLYISYSLHFIVKATLIYPVVFCRVNLKNLKVWMQKINYKISTNKLRDKFQVSDISTNKLYDKFQLSDISTSKYCDKY